MINSAISYVENREYEIAPTHKDPNGVRNKTRSSTVSWINWDEWIPGIMYNMVVSANKEFFKYDITHFATRIQSTILMSMKVVNCSFIITNHFLGRLNLKKEVL